MERICIKLQYYVKYAIIIMYKKTKAKKEGNAMKMPEQGNFMQEEGSVYAKNDVTGDEIIFYGDEEVNILIRSMLEEDIDKVRKGHCIPARKVKALQKMLESNSSQYCRFIIAELEITGYDDERKVLGDAVLLENGDIEIQIYMKHYNPIIGPIIKQRVTHAMKQMMEKMDIKGEMKVYRLSVA